MQLVSSLASALTYPRRAIWHALGLPAHGADLLGYLGMDPHRGLTRALGTGLEMLGDPLLYAGGAVAPLLMGGGEDAMNPAVLAQLDDLFIAGANAGNQPDDQDNSQTSALLRSLGGY